MNAQLPPLPPSPPPTEPLQKQVVRKSPGLAVIFSLLPGLGHIYLGLYERGIAFFAAFLAALWLTDHADLSSAVVAFVFFFAMLDAHRMAVASPLLVAPLDQALTPETIPHKGRGNWLLGVILLAAGALLLYGNFYPLDLSFLADWWPLGLVLFGLWIILRDLRGKRAASEPFTTSFGEVSSRKPVAEKNESSERDNPLP
ncbi:MAG: hypothetical protein N2447_09655 [Thermoanaerobaculum sp.]|nr:hypothetical protein [Thermoanaerobaculum sp.]